MHYCQATNLHIKLQAMIQNLILVMVYSWYVNVITKANYILLVEESEEEEQDRGNYTGISKFNKISFSSFFLLLSFPFFPLEKIQVMFQVLTRQGVNIF